MQWNPTDLKMLFYSEDYLPTISFRTDCEVNPYPRAPHLDNQLIEVILGLVCNIKQYHRISQCLLLTNALDISRTACKVIRSGASPYPLIHLPRAITGQTATIIGIDKAGPTASMDSFMPCGIFGRRP